MISRIANSEGHELKQVLVRRDSDGQPKLEVRDLVDIGSHEPDEQPMRPTILRADGTPFNSQAQPMEPMVVGTADFSKVELGARMTNNIGVHLLVSDGPAVASIVANFTPLPGWMDQALAPFNALNALTGAVAIAADVREIHGTYKNPLATKTDRVMDVTHLVAGDVVSTAASLVPLIPGGMSHPLGVGFFVGGQLVGIAMDLGKTLYDVKRKGQQSAYKQGQDAVDRARLMTTTPLVTDKLATDKPAEG